MLYKIDDHKNGVRIIFHHYTELASANAGGCFITEPLEHFIMLSVLSSAGSPTYSSSIIRNIHGIHSDLSGLSSPSSGANIRILQPHQPDIDRNSCFHQHDLEICQWVDPPHHHRDDCPRRILLRISTWNK